MTKEQRLSLIRERDQLRVPSRIFSRGQGSAEFVGMKFVVLPENIPTLEELPQTDVTDILQMYSSTMESNQPEEL